MQIQSQSNPLAMMPQAAAANTSSTTGSTDPTAATDPLANENTFLQLLVAQIKNQDPTQPVDSSTFLTQLAQFSSLEQLIGIHNDLNATAPATSTTGTGSTTGS
jgi:flagellar basal-body rod modification protein FlgD